MYLKSFEFVNTHAAIAFPSAKKKRKKRKTLNDLRLRIPS
ncbi:unnamed protein product, partial [Musa acuminata subsp. burmannicoides]